MRVALCLTLSLALAASLSAGVVHSDSEQTTQVYLTIYNDNLALVREVREASLPAGVLDLEFADVAAQIDPTTVHIASQNHPDALAVLEQNFEYDLLSPDRLLENFIGRNVRFIQPLSTGDQTHRVVEGRLLSVQGGRIIESDGEIVINPHGEIHVEADTGDLRAEPTLVWLLESGGENDHTLEISYLTSGISWEADYVAVVNNTDTGLDLTGWVTIDNRSGATYGDANLKLVAGDVNRAQQPQVMMDRMRGMELAMAQAPQFQEESFFEYHLYSLQRPATVRDRQTKQMTLLTADAVGIVKRYIFESPWYNPWYRHTAQPNNPEHVSVVVEFDNSEENNMGMPLPKGTVRLYRGDSDGALQFIGEDNIDHTPRDERLRLEVGQAFDVVAERTQMDFRELMGDRTEQDWRIVVRNHKDEDITVTLSERANGDWTVTRESHPHEQISSDRLEFTVDVPANGETEVTYTLHFRND
jgi:hypothetical protein